ncbi:MAG: IPT/TIG domain-containing protein, partial [Actinobacteria bacterium]|nr:IPT/TIG domain-containing protein [Actinomycetota bacterium]
MELSMHLRKLSVNIISLAFISAVLTLGGLGAFSAARVLAADPNQGDVSRIQQKTWYLAEGYTGGTFETWVLVQNPGETQANVTMDFQLPAGQTAAPFSFVLEGGTRMNVKLDDLPGLANTEVSTKVSADVGIYVQRSMYFDYESKRGGSSCFAAAIPDSEWYLAEGYTGGNFEEWILVQNPGPDSANVTMTFQVPAGNQAEPYVFELPGHTRHTVKVDDLPGLAATDVSTKVSATRPVVVERAMYYDYNGKDGGDCSLGVTGTDTEFFIPEGYTGGEFDTYILIQNPGTEAATVDFAFQLDGGQNAPGITHVVEAGTRFSVKLDDQQGLSAAEVSTVITSDKPIVAERATYFAYNGVDDGSSSPASDSVSDLWQLPEGCTRDGFDTYVLVQNPGDSRVHVSLEFQLPPGMECEPFEFSVPAMGREGICLNQIDGLPRTDVSTTVRASAPVVVESSMYYGLEGKQGGHGCLGLIPNTLLPNGVMLDEASEALITTAAGNQVIFSSSNELIDSIEAGDVVCAMPCAGAPSGFLRKVVEVQSAGEAVMLVTEQAALQEFIRYGYFYGNNYTPEVAPAAGFDITVPFDLSLGSYGNMKGSVSVGVHLDISIHIKWKWKIIPWGFTFRIAAGIDEGADFTLTAGDDFSLNKEFKLKTYNLSPIDAGPLVFFPRVSVYAGFNGNLAKGTVLSCSESLTATAGFGYDGWYTIADFDADASADASLPRAVMDAKPYLREAIECLLYDVVGPYIDVMEYIRLHSNPDENPWWAVFGGVQADGGVDIDLLIWTLKWSGKIYGKEWLIAHAPYRPVLDSLSPGSGTIGTEVTLSGSHFGSDQGDSYVSFGGVKATEYTSWADGQVVCKVP